MSTTSFTREYIYSDGTKQKWIYDLEKWPNGPIEVKIDTPKSSIERNQRLEEENQKLPLTKRKFWNTQTGKEVSYTRAKQLGLIK